MQCVTVRRYGSKTARTPFGCVPIWTIAVYSAYTTKDKRTIWRHLYDYGATCSGSGVPKSLIESAQRYADAIGLKFKLGIRQNNPIGG